MLFSGSCLLGTLQQKPDNVQTIILAALCLHILMHDRYPRLQNQDVKDVHQSFIGGVWHSKEVPGVQFLQWKHSTCAAKLQRNYVMSYLNSSVPWQNDHA